MPVKSIDVPLVDATAVPDTILDAVPCTRIVPDTAGNVCVLLPETAGDDTVIEPDVLPERIKDAMITP
jgi:hypothetical protein